MPAAMLYTAAARGRTAAPCPLARPASLRPRSRLSMKIERVENLLAGRWHFVRITTDTGLVGVGESGIWR